MRPALQEALLVLHTWSKTNDLGDPRSQRDLTVPNCLLNKCCVVLGFCQGSFIWKWIGDNVEIQNWPNEEDK